jgi:hypothetical protein
MVLTFVEFPFRYFDLVAEDPGIVWLVAARDAAMLAVVALCWVAMARDRAERQR